MHIVLALGIRGKHIYSTAEAPLKTIARTSHLDFFLYPSC